MQDKQYINAEPQNVICALHGQFFRKKWPSGYPIFAVRSAELVLGDIQFAREWEALKEEQQLESNEEAISACLALKPLCCRLPKASLEQILFEIQRAHKDLWSKKICYVCGNVGLGTDLEQQNPISLEIEKIPHVCLRCFVYRLKQI